MEQLPLKAQKAVQAALQRAGEWLCPPHWNPRQWQEELESIAHASACQAFLTSEEQKKVSIEAFVFYQVLAALRDFHRQEWAYFVFHCAHLSRLGGLGEDRDGDEGMDVCCDGCDMVEMARREQGWWRYLVRWAMGRLSERERRVLEGLFFEEYTEEEMAQELGISHQAVNKIKKRALEKMGRRLRGLI